MDMMLFLFSLFILSFCDINIPQTGVSFDNCLGGSICNVTENCWFDVGNNNKNINNDIEIKSDLFFTLQLNGSFTLSIQSGKIFRFSKLEVYYFNDYDYHYF
jgi:hypothetical protein